MPLFATLCNMTNYTLKYVFFVLILVLRRKGPNTLSKLPWPIVRKICSIDQEKLLKFEAEGTEFAKFWDH